MSAALVRVGDLAEQVRGVTYSIEDASLTPKPGYLPVLRAGNITDDGLVFDDLVYVPAERVSSRQLIRRHDVVIAASSGSLDVVGKAAPALADFNGGFGAFCKVLRPNAKVHPGYFAQFFKTQDYRRRVSSLAAGANINNLRNEHLDEMPIPLPPLAEQRRIAEILDKADALRAKRRAALAQLDALTKSIFFDMFGDPATNPKGWPEGRLAEVLSDVKPGFACGENPDDGVFQFRMNNVTTEGRLDFSKKRRVPRDTRNLGAFLVLPGDILFNATNSPDLVGKSVFFPGHAEPVVFSNYFLRLRPSPERIEGRFLAQWLGLQFHRGIFRRMCRQWVNQATVGRDALLSLRIRVPPLDLQHYFADRVVAVDRLKTTHRALLAELDALFAALQQLAFRGEL